MKSIYLRPRTVIIEVALEKICALSEEIPIGEGSGGNTPEVKAWSGQRGASNPVSWDDDWE